MFLRSFILLILFICFLSSINATTNAQFNGDASELSETDLILLEIQRTRAEIMQLQTEQMNISDNNAELLADRLGALEQRIVGVENRLNRIFLESDYFDQKLTYAIGAMVAIAMLTLIALWGFRKKVTDPIEVQLLKIRTDQHVSSANTDSKALSVLKEIAKEDPFVAQIMKKHNLT
ncbi:MAG: hypothetical protein LAT67_07795 [Balneolales bacterium]|nr:hypothetical protein [Balneolales bacterium]